jgi:uroporphyrinogen-III synthase
VRILVVRPVDEAPRLVERLLALGLEVVACPLLEARPLGDAPVATAGYDWVVVTSRTGARELLRRGERPLPRVAAVGPGTAEALREGGVEPALVPAVSTQEGLVAAFPQPSGRILFAGAAGARRHLAEALEADFLATYETVVVAVEVPDADLVALTSASGARAFAAFGRDLPCVSIGPQTTAAAREAGLRVVAEASTHDLDGLVEAIRSTACSSPS